MHCVKEDDVERSEGADYSAAHEQQERIIEFIVFFNLVRNQRGRKGNPGSHDDEPQINTIHANMIVEANGGHPCHLLDELVAENPLLEAKQQKE